MPSGADLGPMAVPDWRSQRNVAHLKGEFILVRRWGVSLISVCLSSSAGKSLAAVSCFSSSAAKSLAVVDSWFSSSKAKSLAVVSEVDVGSLTFPCGISGTVLQRLAVMHDRARASSSSQSVKAIEQQSDEESFLLAADKKEGPEADHQPGHQHERKGVGLGEIGCL